MRNIDERMQFSNALACTYQEYKWLQTRQAFKRSISSKKIKRIVR